MKIVTNDMMVQDQFRDKYIAIQEIRKSIRVLLELKKHADFEKLFAERNIFRQWELAPDYYFEQLFSEDNALLSRNEKTLIKSMFVNFNKIKIPEKLFRFGEKESAQCAWAYLNQSILFSVPVNEKWESAKLAGILKSGDERQNVEISNIAVMEHIKTHEEQLQIRRYEFNPKHKIDVGWGTEMDLTDQEAQELLMKAIPTDHTYNRLIAEKGGRYYSFRRHHDNCYHGYWDNTMTEKYKMMVDKYFVQV
ncbi:MAG: hypothetical protein HFI46_09960 [Lachnospiraceae bacterium]|nr:hypothetical protein [Lachnospiraceae bacterium]